jgi:tRNA threonylcarbamoyladenosine biosynthesis protein TsaB
MLLAIETSTKQLGVAVADGERVLASYEVLADYPHAVELPGAVTRVLEGARTTLAKLDGIVIDIGPGSFTGLRIGLAFVKALAFGSKRPVVAVSSLDVLAAQVPFAPGLVCPLLDARQNNVYAALYQMDAGAPVKRSDYFLGPLADWLPKVTSAALFLGDGCALYHDRLVSELGDKARFAPQDAWLPRVATLCRLGAARLAKGQFDGPAALVPLYLYPLDCSVRGPDRPTAVLPKAASTVL